MNDIHLFIEYKKGKRRPQCYQISNVSWSTSLEVFKDPKSGGFFPNYVVGKKTVTGSIVFDDKNTAPDFKKVRGNVDFVLVGVDASGAAVQAKLYGVTITEETMGFGHELTTPYAASFRAEAVVPWKPIG